VSPVQIAKLNKYDRQKKIVTQQHSEGVEKQTHRACVIVV